MRKLNLVFGHSNLSQFRRLHEYLNWSGLANSWLICSKRNYEKYNKSIPNLIPCQPHGNKLKSEDSFYYLTRVEGANRRSLTIYNALADLNKTIKIDLYLGHITAGSTSMLFNRVKFPVMTYLEFPSFRAHGWDSDYPPSEIKKLRDKNFEMLTWHAVMKSDRSIVPTEYARSLFPESLHNRIDVQIEGFPLQIPHFYGEPILNRQNSLKYIGFAARDLSTAKGFHQFVHIANTIINCAPKVRFVVIGSESVLYSYENEWITKRYGENSKVSFVQHVMNENCIDASKFQFFGKLEYPRYSQLIQEIDLFLYPLQFGSANWGIFELLSRGKAVIASNRCFLPEFIEHGINGLLCNYDDIERWKQLSLSLLENNTHKAHLEKNALLMSHEFRIDDVADRYLSIFERVVRNHRNECY